MDDLIAGDVAPELVVRRGEHLCLRYPAIFAERKIEPIHYAEPLRDAGLLHLDRMAPNRLAREIDGVHGLWLTAAATGWFIALAGDRWDSEEPAARARAGPDRDTQAKRSCDGRWLALAFAQAVRAGRSWPSRIRTACWQVETDRVTRYAKRPWPTGQGLVQRLAVRSQVQRPGGYLLIPAE